MTEITSSGDVARVQGLECADKVALVDDDRTWTFAQLDQESSRRPADAARLLGEAVDQLVEGGAGPHGGTCLVGIGEVVAADVDG